jgi:uncharacterized iron-regulated membrane protein
VTVAVVCLTIVVLAQQAAILWLTVRPRRRKRPVAPRERFDHDVDRLITETRVAMGDLPDRKPRLVGLDGGF